MPWRQPMKQEPIKEESYDYVIDIFSNAAIEVKLGTFAANDHTFDNLLKQVQDEEFEVQLLDLLMFSGFTADVFEMSSNFSVSHNNFKIVVKDKLTGLEQEFDSTEIASKQIQKIEADVSYFGYDEISKGLVGQLELKINEPFSIQNLFALSSEYCYSNSESSYCQKIVDSFSYRGYKDPIFNDDCLEIISNSIDLIPLTRNIILNSGVK